MQRIETREQLLAALRRGLHFIYNDFGGSDPKMCAVHTQYCTWIERMLDVKPGRLSVPKIAASDLGTLLSHLRATRRVHSLCSFCRPQPTAGARPVRPARAVTTAPPDVTPAATRQQGRGREGGAFHVEPPCADRQIVEAWTATRLPFEPKGEMRALRDAIRAGLAGLSPAADNLCHGVYVSESTEFCDAENILFYNVGTGAFSRLGARGLAFERHFGPLPTPPVPLEPHPAHFHRYCLLAIDAPWEYWRPTDVVWRAAAMLPAGPLRPERVWWALRAGCTTGRPDVVETEQGFGLRVVVGPGIGVGVEALKVVFDGAVAAAHRYSGDDLEVCAARIASLLGKPVPEVATALVDAPHTPLGPRRLVWPRANGVQWNPADDRCVAGSLILDRSRPPRALDAELYTVAKR